MAEMKPISRITRSRRGVLEVVLVYASVAGLWIMYSDWALGLLFADPAMLVKMSMIKGGAFVAITAMLLYVLVSRLVGQIETAHRRDREIKLQQQAPAMLAAIADNIDDAIFVKDLEGRYLMFNRAASEFVGKPVEAVLGRDDRALFPLKQAEMLIATNRRLIENEALETNEEIVSTAKGERVFLATKGPLRDAEGRIFGTFGVSRDITARKQVEDRVRSANKRLQKVIDNNIVGVMFWDISLGRLVDANDYFFRLTGFTRREMEAGEMTWQRLTPPEYVELSLAEMENLARDGHLGPYQKEYFRKDGSRVWLLFAGSLIEENVCVEFCVDITELKVAEERVTKRNLELERFNRAAIDRELRMIELKQEVNALAQALGGPPPYDLSFAEESGRERHS